MPSSPLREKGGKGGKRKEGARAADTWHLEEESWLTKMDENRGLKSSTTSSIFLLGLKQRRRGRKGKR